MILRILFDIDTIHSGKQTFLVDVQKAGNDDNPVVAATLKNIYQVRSKTPDHIVISKGLAEKVGLGDGEIKILRVTADINDLDLDKWK